MIGLISSGIRSDDVTALLYRTVAVMLYFGDSMTQILKGRFDGSKAAHRNQSAAPESFPERWTVDPQGQRILIGLSAAETKEFQALDALSPSDGEEVGWTFGGEPTTRREKRWLEL